MRSLLVPALLLCAASAFAAPDRIPASIDNNRFTRLRNHVHPRLQTATDEGPVPADFVIQNAIILLKPGPGLEAFLTAVQTPGSPDYHRFLSPEQFADRFGASSTDAARIVDWLSAQGLRVTHIARSRQWVAFDGAASNVSRAFRTEIRRYRSNGEQHFANATAPAIPLALESSVAAIRGLHDFRLSPMLKPAASAPDFNSTTGRHYLAPDDVALIYNAAPLYAAGFDGTGQSVAIVGQTNIDIKDIRAFRQRFNLPDNDPRIVLVGPSPGNRPADQPEANLDVEWSGAIARNATIIYVNSTDVFTSLIYAIDNNIAPVVSMSYGGCEIENTPDLRIVAQQANAQGITWVASSGDAGAAGCDFTTPTPLATKGAIATFPASIPEVTAIGGTTLSEGAGNYWAASNTDNGASVLSYIPEVAWNDSASRNEFAATGGGISAFYPKPFWQSAPGVPKDGMRLMPDISFAASPDHDGYLVQTTGTLAVYGGTSVGTPIFAGSIALLNQYLTTSGFISQPGLGNVNPGLYRLATAPGVYHDVVSGDNKEPCAQGTPDCVDGFLGFSAGPGYDPVTGLGTPDLWQLVKKYSTGLTSTTWLSAPTHAGINETVNLSVSVGTGLNTATPTGVVEFFSSYNSLGRVSLRPGIVAGAAFASLAVPMVRIAEDSGLVTAWYGGDGVVEASGGSAIVNLDIPSTGSLVVPAIDPNPVYQFGSVYRFGVTLQEVAGVATSITGFSIDGVNQSLTLLPRTTLAANGAISALLVTGSGTNVNAGIHVFSFSGRDANGRIWSQAVTATFVPSNARALTPSITLTVTPSSVVPNPANPSCQWSQQIRVQENSGFLTNLSAFTVTAGTSATSLTSQVQQIFGTTRLGPYSTLYGTLCWDSRSITPAKTFLLSGVGEIGGVSSSAAATYQTAPVSGNMTLSKSVLVFNANPRSTTAQSQTIDLSFTGADAVWSVSALPNNYVARWLTISSGSGFGPGSFAVTANPAGLPNGVYRVFVTVQATNTQPQAVNIPVTLVIGASSTLSLSAVSNAASFGPAAAPGAQMRVIGLNLASSSLKAARFPLPLTLAGVSATVNGIAAPLISVAPDSIVFQVPYETAPGSAVLAINNNGTIAWQEFPVAIAAPGIFASQTSHLLPVSSAVPG
jgi:hypothetical protein